MIGGSVAGYPANFNNSSTDQVKVTLYPNPVIDGNLTIKAEKEITKLQIVNIVGEKILSEKEPEPSTNVHLDLNNLKSGIYLIIISFADNTSNTKRIWVK